MSSTDRRAPRRPIAAVLAAVAVLGVGCGPEPFAQEGSGVGESESFEVDTGTASISWSAWDTVPPVDGCLFGLILDPEELRAANELAPPVFFSPPKLAYQVLDGGGSYNGRTALELPAGRYRFVIEGSCSWSVRFDGH